MSEQRTMESPLASLERFIVDNEELLELEETIGRFNIFDALKLSRNEIRHSNFLAWLLDPGESHGQGDLFLKTILMDVLSIAPAGCRPFSPIELDDANLQGVEIRREWNHIDILITCNHPAFVVIIENKIDSGEHGKQLARYEEIVTKKFEGVPRLCVFLTTDGDTPSHASYVPYTYENIHRVLLRCQKTFAGAIGSDLLVVLDHYLRLIGSRFMENQQIQELCRRIYKNHRQALDLIIETVGTPAAEIIDDIKQRIGSKSQWTVVTQTSHGVDFVPTEWVANFPPIGKRKSFDRKFWVVLKIRMREGRCTSGAYVWPTTNPDLRLQVIHRLTDVPEDFGLRLFSKKIVGNSFTEIGGKTCICEWGEDEEPDRDKVLQGVESRLMVLEQQLRGVLTALRPIFQGAQGPIEQPRGVCRIIDNSFIAASGSRVL